MHTFRVTLLTAAGSRVRLPFVAPSQQDVHARLDELYPDRLFTLCICTSRRTR